MMPENLQKKQNQKRQRRLIHGRNLSYQILRPPSHIHNLRLLPRLRKLLSNY